MIKIISRGGSASQRKSVNSIARFSGHKLMSDKLADTITVNIKLISNLFKKEGVYGDVLPVDFESRRYKEYVIRADASMRLRPLLETIAHEMVHVKQYARDEMREITKNGSTVNRWHKEYFPLITNYWEQPWEIEAHGREKGLFEMWADDAGVYKKGKAKWAYENHFPKGYLDKI